MPRLSLALDLDAAADAYAAGALCAAVYYAQTRRDWPLRLGALARFAAAWPLAAAAEAAQTLGLL